MITIDEIAKEKGTMVFTVALADENGDAVTPNTLLWSLTDSSGNIINNRDRTSVSSPAASNTIVLSGDDLQIQTSEAALNAIVRKLIVEATYDSDLGSDLPANESGAFVIENLPRIA